MVNRNSSLLGSGHRSDSSFAIFSDCSIGMPLGTFLGARVERAALAPLRCQLSVS
ncbi:hypothetical protein JOF56_004491 [Kibdelosporangium banguiense]|uniref:Uncharacterized protein n=1 Tax=Kibdelosporangium banguiense TaxID=1365924 RepID=A0ABS4TI48_9PSEU|nr:hypothetical protein [Kibdelosporangium banguiense]